jgi:hypothetical protein
MLRLHHFVHRGPRRWARGVWFASLRNKYREEYRLLEREWDGELYEQQWREFGETLGSWACVALWRTWLTRSLRQHYSVTIVIPTNPIRGANPYEQAYFEPTVPPIYLGYPTARCPNPTTKTIRRGVWEPDRGVSARNLTEGNTTSTAKGSATSGPSSPIEG